MFSIQLLLIFWHYTIVDVAKFQIDGRIDFGPKMHYKLHIAQVTEGILNLALRKNDITNFIENVSSLNAPPRNVSNKIVNKLLDRMGLHSKNSQSLRNEISLANAVQKGFNVDEFIHICNEYKICRTGRSFSDFTAEILSMILRTDDRSVKQASDALTEGFDLDNMDRCVDTNFEQQTIYQIYRACRLCGAGAGYKMPIIQNVVDLDGRDVELRQKIRECVQIEVSQDDKMPPLICELCVDKVNDFYEFFDMCRQTNKRTRHRLGLPPQTLPRGATDDCILGLTEPVYVNEDSNEPISRHRSKVQKAKVKKEPESKSKVVVKVEEKSVRRLTRASVPSPPPAPRETRRSDAHGKKAPTPLKSILKKEKDIKAEDNGLSRSKRSREDTPEMPTKRVKIAAKPVVRSVAKAVAKPSAKNVAKPSPKNHRGASNPGPREQRAPSAKPHFACHICAKEFPSSLSLAVHQRIHQVKQLKNSRCVTKETRSPSRTRGGKCDKCGRTYLTRKNFLRHESYCTFKKKVSQAVVEPAVLRSLRRVQVRVARCDALLAARGHCRVADLPQEYGLDQRCVYPYISSVRSLRIKSEPGEDFMVDIGEGIKQELEDVGYVHWDSDDSSDQEDSERDFAPKKRTPEPLSTLALKTVFSQRCLGKVPRKRRRIKAEMPVADEPVDRFDDVNDLERIGEAISDKVASIDGLLGDVDDVGTVEKTGTEECRAQNSGEVDCGASGLMEVVGGDCCSVKLESVVGDATGDVSQKSMSSYSPRLEINGDESNAENEMDVSEEVNGELSNTNIKEIKTEMNISIDNVNECIVNNEENNIEVAEKEKVGSDCNQKDSSAEDGVATDEPSQEMGDSYVDSNIVVASESIPNKEVSSEIKIEENDLAQETDDAQTARDTDADEISADETSRNVDAERDGESERKSNIPSERDSNNSDERDSNVPDEKDSNVTEERESNVSDGQESNFPDDRDSNVRDEQDSNIPDERDSNVSVERRGNIPDGFETEWQSVMAEEIEAGDRAASTNGIDAATKREDEIMDEFHASQGYDGGRADVNGREQIDAELEDRRLMEALDAQIGECEGDGACDRDKITLADLLPDKAHEKSLDLDGMADEFAFDP
ncbi:unnamed protein product, partial [Iphiclides podalirius]